MSPTPPGDGSTRQAWKQALAAGPSCLSLECLAADELTPADRAHLDGCSRCQTERALWMAFEEAAPSADEDAAVEWIARETRRRVFPAAEPAVQPAPSSGWFLLPTWATSMAAALAVAVGVFLLVRNPSPAIDGPQPAPVYRAAVVELLSPAGDVQVVPSQLRWQSTSGAMQYDVKVLEVDGTEIWRTTTSSSTVTLPEAVRTAAKPARTLTWSVTALDASGRRVADPGTATFRVVMGGTPPGA